MSLFDMLYTTMVNLLSNIIFIFTYTAIRSDNTTSQTTESIEDVRNLTYIDFSRDTTEESTALSDDVGRFTSVASTETQNEGTGVTETIEGIDVFYMYQTILLLLSLFLSFTRLI